MKGTINDYNRDIVGYHQVCPKMVDFPPIAIDSHSNANVMSKHQFLGYPVFRSTLLIWAYLGDMLQWDMILEFFFLQGISVHLSLNSLLVAWVSLRNLLCDSSRHAWNIQSEGCSPKGPNFPWLTPIYPVVI